MWPRSLGWSASNSRVSSTSATDSVKLVRGPENSGSCKREGMKAGRPGSGTALSRGLDAARSLPFDESKTRWLLKKAKGTFPPAVASELAPRRLLHPA
jgi:hypothetical protein